MTEQQHPIPPQELIDQLFKSCPYVSAPRVAEWIATQSAQWGWEQRGADIEAKLQKARDEELEACEEWLNYNYPLVSIHHLRAARRPKPKTQAEEALGALDHLNEAAQSQAAQSQMDTTEAVDIIRSALERLREHEQQVEAQVNG